MKIKPPPNEVWFMQGEIPLALLDFHEKTALKGKIKVTSNKPYKIINKVRFPMKEYSADEIEAKGLDQSPANVFMTPEELSCFRHRLLCVVFAILSLISWIIMILLY